MVIVGISGIHAAIAVAGATMASEAVKVQNVVQFTERSLVLARDRS